MATCSIPRRAPRKDIAPPLRLEAGGTADLLGGVELRGNGVGNHRLQDVVLTGDDVLHQEVGGFIDVDVFLERHERMREDHIKNR